MAMVMAAAAAATLVVRLLSALLTPRYLRKNRKEIRDCLLVGPFPGKLDMPHAVQTMYSMNKKPDSSFHPHTIRLCVRNCPCFGCGSAKNVDNECSKVDTVPGLENKIHLLHARILCGAAFGWITYRIGDRV